MTVIATLLPALLLNYCYCNLSFPLHYCLLAPLSEYLICYDDQVDTDEIDYMDDVLPFRHAWTVDVKKAWE
jgi:hypothetical protein